MMIEGTILASELACCCCCAMLACVCTKNLRHLLFSRLQTRKQQMARRLRQTFCPPRSWHFRSYRSGVWFSTRGGGESDWPITSVWERGLPLTKAVPVVLIGGCVEQKGEWMGVATRVCQTMCCQEIRLQHLLPLPLTVLHARGFLFYFMCPLVLYSSRRVHYLRTHTHSSRQRQQCTVLVC